MMEPINVRSTSATAEPALYAYACASPLQARVALIHSLRGWTCLKGLKSQVQGVREYCPQLIMLLLLPMLVVTLLGSLGPSKRRQARTLADTRPWLRCGRKCAREAAQRARRQVLHGIQTLQHIGAACGVLSDLNRSVLSGVHRAWLLALWSPGTLPSLGCREEDGLGRRRLEGSCGFRKRAESLVCDSSSVHLPDGATF